jgi:hypothetical protein
MAVASKNVKSQLPHLIEQFPEIKDVYPATINVKLDEPFSDLKYDFTTSPIQWWDADANRPELGFRHTESFSFLRIKFEYPTGGPIYNAWLFGCHDSHWFNDPLRLSHEVIAEKIANLSYNTRCRIIHAR